MNAMLALAAVALAGPPTSAALRAAQPTVDRGEIKGGPPLLQSFELTNAAASGVVSIDGVEVGCGCIRQMLSRSVLRPGESAELTIEVNTLTQPDGPNRWPVRARYRRDRSAEGNAAPEFGALALLLAAKLVREVTVTPPQLSLSASGEVSRTLTVRDVRSSPLKVMKATTSSPHLTARVALPTRESASGGVTRITLKLSADAPAGIRDETVVLHTDDAAYPEFRVPVRIEKREPGAASAAPDGLSLRFSAGETEATGLVQVRAADGRSVAVEGVECEHPAVKAKWSVGRGPVAAVRAAVSATTGAAGGKAELRIRLAEPKGQLLIVPVEWSGVGR